MLLPVTFECLYNREFSNGNCGPVARYDRWWFAQSIRIDRYPVSIPSWPSEERTTVVIIHSKVFKVVVESMHRSVTTDDELDGACEETIHRQLSPSRRKEVFAGVVPYFFSFKLTRLHNESTRKQEYASRTAGEISGKQTKIIEIKVRISQLIQLKLSWYFLSQSLKFTESYVVCFPNINYKFKPVQKIPSQYSFNSLLFYCCLKSFGKLLHCQSTRIRNQSHIHHVEWSSLPWPIRVVSRVASRRTSRVLEQANFATSGLVSLRSVFHPVTFTRLRRAFGGGPSFRMKFSRRALWQGWHVQDCASRKGGRKEGRKNSLSEYGWISHKWCRWDIPRRDVIKRVARGLIWSTKLHASRKHAPCTLRKIYVPWNTETSPARDLIASLWY